MSTGEEKQAMTREELEAQLEDREKEAAAYLGLLAPLLHKMGGEAILTQRDAAEVPQGVCVWQEQIAEDSIRIYLGKPSTP